MKKFVLSLLVFLFSMGLAQAQNAPSIKVLDLNRNSVAFDSLVKKGQITVVSFWATWCGPCIKELQAIDDNKYEDWQTRFGVELIAVSIDDARNSVKVKPFVTSRGWEYTVVLDQNSELFRELGGVNPPTLFIYDSNGNLAYSHQGYVPGSEEDIEEELIRISGAATEPVQGAGH